MREKQEYSSKFYNMAKDDFIYEKFMCFYDMYDY